MLSIPRQVRRFGSDTSGAVAILFGIGVIVLTMFTGLAVDSARIYNVSSRVQAALDAAALAGAKKMNIEGATTAEIKATAQSFFDAQLPGMTVNGAQLTHFHTTLDRNEGTVLAKVDVALSTIMGAISRDATNTTFTPSSSATYKALKVEVALVLDITGSMCNPCTKLDDLKVAAKQMIDTLYASNPTKGAIKVSLVPYSASVNVGGTYFNRVAVTGGAIDTCVMEREGINMHTNALPSAGSLFETTGNTPVRPGYSCPNSEIVPLTDLEKMSDRNAFKAQIDALAPVGATAGHLGLGWGWYTLTPEWSSIWPGASKPRSYGEDVIKAIILMTDGEFNTSYWDNGINLTGTDRTDPLVADSSGYQTLQLCSNIKTTSDPRYAPKIYTVSFMAPPGADALMQQCAGAGNAFTAENRTGLTQAFSTIVERLTNLSLTQ